MWGLAQKAGEEQVKFFLLKKEKKKISNQSNTVGFAFIAGMTAVSTQTP